MTRRAARTDANHAAIVAAARAVGAAVLDVHALPGALDALIGFRGVLRLVEIKDGAKKPSARKLTSAETETIALFVAVDCPVHVIASVDELYLMLGII